VSRLCESVWKDAAIHLGDSLRTCYLNRIADEGLTGLAAEASTAKGEPGGATKEDADKHFAWRFANSAGRTIYTSVDPERKLRVAYATIAESFVDGDVVLADVPSGAGAGALGLLATIYEHRKSGLAPTLPLRVRVVAGDFSERAGEHLDALFDALKEIFATQALFVSLTRMHWDANKIETSAIFIDAVVEHAKDADRVFFLVSNFSGALKDADLEEKFRHFLSQFSSRVKKVPNSMIWVEPNTSGAKSLLPKIRGWLAKFLSWLKSEDGGGVQSAQYSMCDPFTGNFYPTGVVVLQCRTEGMPWQT
jgi:hypothetical protein